MVTHALNINELPTNDYTLIGIHTTLSEYKLAYLLNKYLDIKFSKATDDLDFTQNNSISFYALYEYKSTELEHNWFLIANTNKPDSKIETNISNINNSLTYLIPEKKKIDYFLKIENSFDTDAVFEKIQIINKIPQIIISYQVELESLKSKDFLIF